MSACIMFQSLLIAICNCFGQLFLQLSRTFGTVVTLPPRKQLHTCERMYNFQTLLIAKCSCFRGAGLQQSRTFGTVVTLSPRTWGRFTTVPNVRDCCKPVPSDFNAGGGTGLQLSRTFGTVVNLSPETYVQVYGPNPVESTR